VDYLIDNKTETYTSELLKKVDINWNEFYEKKNYKTEKEEEDKKEQGNKNDIEEDEKDED